MKISKKLQLFFKSMVMKASKVNSDKGMLVWDGEDALAEGMELYIQVDTEEGVDYNPVEDGDYTLEDGTVVTAAEGKVSAIKAPEAKEEEKPAEEAENAPAEMSEEDPKETEIEALDAPAEAPAEAPEEAKDEKASIEDRMDAMEAHVADMNAAFEQILAAIEGYEERIAALEAKIAEVSDTPADVPAEEFAREKEEESNTLAGKLKAFYSNR